MDRPISSGGGGAPPAPWRVIQIDRKVPPTRYRVATIDGMAAVEATANRSMALLARPLEIDLTKLPVLCWKWRIDAPVSSADMRRKRGDDYAARVYVASDIPDDSLSGGTKLKLRIACGIFRYFSVPKNFQPVPMMSAKTSTGSK